MTLMTVERMADSDKAGRLYVATRMGIQVCDQAGRVNCIIPTPNGLVSNLASAEINSGPSTPRAATVFTSGS
jgi:hypothetical protein